MATISTSGISALSQIKSEHLLRIINALNGTTSNDVIISGSLSNGFNTPASGDYSHAEGSSTQATNRAAHAEGISTIASGTGSHAEGQLTIASGNYSHAEGSSTQATGHYSHAEGENTKASGYSSHAEGERTISSGNYSHAEGHFTTASGNYSHTEGLSTVASGNYQHVQGQYNISSSVSGAFIHGNGTSDAARSNLIYAHDSIVEVTGSISIKNILTLTPTSSLPTGQPTGSFIVSGSNGNCKPYFYNGTTWTALF
jgi:hypothetical protein